MAPSIDFSKPRDLVSELFDPDDGIKKQFNDRFSRQVIEFAERLSPGFARFENLMKGQHGMQTALACIFHAAATVWPDWCEFDDDEVGCGFCEVLPRPSAMDKASPGSATKYTQRYAFFVVCAGS